MAASGALAADSGTLSYPKTVTPTQNFTVSWTFGNLNGGNFCANVSVTLEWDHAKLQTVKAAKSGEHCVASFDVRWTTNRPTPGMHRLDTTGAGGLTDHGPIFVSAPSPSPSPVKTRPPTPRPSATTEAAPVIPIAPAEATTTAADGPVAGGSATDSALAVGGTKSTNLGFPLWVPVGGVLLLLVGGGLLVWMVVRNHRDGDTDQPEYELDYDLE
jgi:hypothetical protein